MNDRFFTNPSAKSVDTWRAITPGERAQAVALHEEISKPIINDLRSIGYDIESLDELRKSGKRYRTAVPILLKWLRSISDADVKESIVRTLSVPWAAPDATVALIEEFKLAPAEEELLKWAIGNALEVIADDSVLDQILELVRDKRHGRTREMIVMGLGRMQSPKAINVLLEVLTDADVTGHAIIALGKLRAPHTRSAIEPYVNHPKAWIRKEAKKALERINRRR